MSGFEVVGVIAGAIGLFTTTMDLYSAYKDIRGLPQAFLEVNDKIPLVINTLQLIRTEALSASEDRRDIIIKVVKSCEEKAARLNLLFEHLKLDGSTPFELERYVAVIRSWGKKGRVEDLLKKLLEDVRLLADNQTVHAVSEEIFKKLSEALDHLKTISPSAPDDMLETAAGTQISHGGTGPQLNQLGEHNTNNNNWGSGQFFAGGTHHHGPDTEALKNDECRKALRSRSTDPRDDKNRIEQSKGGVFQGAFRWVLKTPEFRSWQSEDAARLLWIKGDPGKGKTMLLCGIINELSVRFQRLPIAYFFCQAADDRINTATSVLLGLIYFVVELFRPLVRHVRTRYDDSQNLLFQGPNARVALEGILLSILQDPELGNACLVIDALDECTADLDELLAFIDKASITCQKVKWIVSSRNYPEIEERLHVAEQAARLSLELNETSVCAAVEAFIRHKVDILAQTKVYSPQIRVEVERHLISNAHGTFLWVALVAQALSRLRLSRKVSETLKKFPSGLDALYDRMMRQISESDEHNICNELLALATVAYRPLSLQELSVFTPDSWVTGDKLRELQTIVQLCGSFLAIRNDTVYWVHQSARDYLLQHHFASSSLRERVHRDIYKSSLAVMLRVLRRDVYGLESCCGRLASGFTVDKFENQRPNPDPLAGLAYPCVHWVEHVRDSGRSDDLGEDGIVKSFLGTSYIYWLEALSILRSLPEGVVSIGLLRSLLKRERTSSTSGGQQKPVPSTNQQGEEVNDQTDNHKDIKLFDMVCDMHRFLLAFRWPIEQHPLQVYASALLLSPLGSITRKLFLKDFPKWVKLEPTLAADWDSCLQTIEPQSSLVGSVAFSPDGRQLASAGSGPVQLWDVTTGCELQTLERIYDDVSSLIFSSDGRQLATTGDHMLTVWNVVTGKKICVFEDTCGLLRAAAFSSDGLINYVATSSHCGEVCIRSLHIATGEVLRSRTITMAPAPWPSLAFSLKGQTLAVILTPGFVSVFNLATNADIKLAHSYPLPSRLDLSPDGQLLAIAGTLWGTDLRAEIHNLATGQVTSLHYPGLTCESLAFSWDGEHLAMAMNSPSSSAIVTYGLTAKKMASIFDQRLADRFSCIRFSPDGRLLASVSQQGTIRLFDRSLGNGLDPHLPTFESISKIKFSFDGLRAAVLSVQEGSKKLGITACSVVPFKRLKRLDFPRENPHVEDVALSPDGQSLAAIYASYNSFGRPRGLVLSLWDWGSQDVTLKRRIELQDLLPHRTLTPDFGRGLTFSPNGEEIAFALTADESLDYVDSLLLALLNVSNTDIRWMSLPPSHNGLQDFLFSAKGNNFIMPVAKTEVDLDLALVGNWDTVTGQCPWLAAKRGDARSLIYGRGLRAALNWAWNWLRTGATGLEGHQNPPRDIATRSLGLSGGWDWITLGGEELIWLPWEYRPRQYRRLKFEIPFYYFWRETLPEVTSSDSLVAFGCDSGFFLAFSFASDESSTIRGSG